MSFEILLPFRLAKRAVRIVGALGVMLISVGAAGDAVAQRLAPELPGGQEQPAWSGEQVATLRSFFERVDVEDALRGVRPPPLDGSWTLSDVAAGLGADWAAPFRFVQSVVGYVPYSGSVRGARGTLLAGAGSALDRSLLLAALYRARGVQTRLVNGDLRWERAVAVVGRRRPDRLTRGDPWLRWVETAADHWWVEARRGGEWVALDTAFRGDPGEVFASGREVVVELPSALRASVRVDVLQGEASIATAIFPLPELVGEPIRLSVRKQVDEPEEPDLDEVLVGLEPVLLPPETEQVLRDLEPQGDLLAALLPRIPAGPVMLELQVGGTKVDAGPFERDALHEVSLRVRTSVPVGPGNEMRVPWGDRLDAQLIVLLGAGRVHSAYLAQAGIRIYDSFEQVVSAEIVALQEYSDRDTEDEELDAREEMSPEAPVEVPGGPDELADALEEAIHPVDALHLAVVRAWLEFELHGPAVIGAALLAATDQLGAGVEILRPGVRMVGFNWQPPDAETSGALTAWLQDPIDVGGVDRAQRRGVQAAYGLLRSAVLGHVLNSLADRPPITAFDVTLRTVGSGHRLVWWQPGGGVPSQWPAEPRSTAGRDLSAGRTLIGPAAPIARGDSSLLAWWALLPESGTTDGRIVVPVGVAQGRVPFVEPRDYDNLESLLATLRDLHRASRWLISVADPDSDVLQELLPRACAATGLVGDLLLAGAPQSWQPPLFGQFCGRIGEARLPATSQP